MKNDLSASLEDYLAAIHRLCQDKPMAHASAIAEIMGVSKSSVSWALNQLSHKGLVNYNPYEAITLTQAGEQLAEKVVRQHEIIKRFLTDVLSVDESLANENACRLEHVLDPEILESMQRFRDGYVQQTAATSESNRESDENENVDSSSPEDNSAINGQEIALPKSPKERDREILERLKAVLAESGHPLTNEEISVAETFMEDEKHRTIDSIYESARCRNPKVTKRCTEQTLDILTEHKIARNFTFQEQQLYEHFHPESHHDHIFCVKCGAIIEFFDPRLEMLQHENVRRCHFRLLHHSHNIFGVCQDCIQRESRSRTLDQCIGGEIVMISRILGDKRTQDRLISMGLLPRSLIHILSEKSAGNHVLIMIGESRIMLDVETARKIKIEPANEGRFHGRQRRHRHRHSIDKVE